MLKTTEFVSLTNEVENGPQLPLRMMDHCMTFIHSDVVMFLGGNTEVERESKQTWTYQFSKQAWTQKADFKTKRSNFGCATFERNGQNVVVLIGGHPNSVEFYDFETDTWSAGPDFPVKVKGLQALTNEKGDGVLVIGGDVENESTGLNRMTNSVYELSCIENECKWVKLSSTLSAPRSYHVAMLVPSNFTVCNKALPCSNHMNFLCLMLLSCVVVYKSNFDF